MYGLAACYYQLKDYKAAVINCTYIISEAVTQNPGTHVTHPGHRPSYTIRYDMIEEINVDRKAECGQLNPLTLTVATWLQLQSILCQTG